MTISLYADSYYEYFLVLLGWIINNNAWEILTQTGIFVLPLIAHLVGTFLRVREQGDDEGNKGRLLAAWIENKLYLSVFMIFLTCYPLFTVNLNSTQISPKVGSACRNPAEATEAKSSVIGQSMSELNGQSAKVPLWWAFVYIMGKGMTNAMTAAIPCTPNLRQMRYEIQSAQLSDPVLIDELRSFVADCFMPARKTLQQQNPNLTRSVRRDIDWIGSNTLVNNFYANYRASSPNANFSYASGETAGLPETEYGGYPNCKLWWEDASAGLKTRLLANVVEQNPSLATTTGRVKNWFSSVSGDLSLAASDWETMILRKLVQPVSETVSNGGSVYGAERYTSSANTEVPLLGALWTKGLSAVGAGATSALSAPAFDAMRSSLPMIQGMLILAIIVSLPILMVFGRYEVKVLVTLTFVLVGVFFLSFWWDLATYIDHYLFKALYASDTHSRWNMSGIMNETDDWLMNLVMGTMFMILPGMWFGMMAWTGVQVGSSLDVAIKQAQGETRAAGEKGIDIAKEVKKGAK